MRVAALVFPTHLDVGRVLNGTAVFLYFSVVLAYLVILRQWWKVQKRSLGYKERVALSRQTTMLLLCGLSGHAVAGIGLFFTSRVMLYSMASLSVLTWYYALKCSDSLAKVFHEAGRNAMALQQITQVIDTEMVKLESGEITPGELVALLMHVKRKTDLLEQEAKELFERKTLQ